MQAAAQTVTRQFLADPSPSGYSVFVTAPPGDTQRVFIVLLTGQVRVFNLATNQLLATPFVTVPTAVNGEQGLLGMAFHPQYQQNGFFYVYYTNAQGLARVIARYRVSQSDPNVADPTSATTILSYNASGPGIHQGGWIGFGPDGYLYIAWGDNGSIGNSQVTTNNLLGKVLRLAMNGPDGIPGTPDDDGFPADPNRNYRIPPSNPFASGGGDPEIWAYGLRNPWRCSIDHDTGDLWIGDPGDSTQEEVDRVPRNQGGLNFGWPCMEGTWCTGMGQCVCNSPGLTMPVYSYAHISSGAAIGGYTYHGCAIPWLRGKYIFGDLSSRVWALSWNGSAVTGVTNLSGQIATITRSFGEDAAGELYMCTTLGVYKIVPSAPYADCNGNGIPDGCEILSGAAPDVNHNFIIDSCEHPWPCNPDYNQDGAAGTDQDIEDFFSCLAGHCCPACGSADFNGDGAVGTDEDIESFFRVLAGGPCY
jgi:glucose/arabinose dehydrogenase